MMIGLPKQSGIRFPDRTCVANGVDVIPESISLSAPLANSDSSPLSALFGVSPAEKMAESAPLSGDPLGELADGRMSLLCLLEL